VHCFDCFYVVLQGFVPEIPIDLMEDDQRSGRNANSISPHEASVRVQGRTETVRETQASIVI
jgi:hypothetical protein